MRVYDEFQKKNNRGYWVKILKNLLFSVSLATFAYVMMESFK